MRNIFRDATDQIPKPVNTLFWRDTVTYFVIAAVGAIALTALEVFSKAP